MKHTTNIIIIFSILLCILFVSCKKDFLTLTPQSQVTEVDFYKTTTDITQAITASYASLQSNSMYGSHFITLIEARADNVEDINPGGNAGRDFNIDRFLAKADNAAVREAWLTLYNAISRCNNIIANVAVVSNTTLKTQYEGEAKFLRALHYFNIVRLWGDAPLVLSPILATDAKKLVRNTKQEIYTAIEADLIAAIAALPITFTGTNTGRATQGAAKALLGKVLLTQQKYSQAVTVLKDLVPATTNIYGYRLLPNIADCFSVTNKNNTEIIFSVKYNKAIVGQGHGLNQYFNQPALDPLLVAAYSNTDTRKDLLNTVTINGSNKPVKKYQDTFDPSNNTLGNDYIIIRYADVLLMYAEALNEVGYNNAGEAFTYLNAVRTRAGATTFTDVNLPDQASFRVAVLQERRLELPLELHRWFDLIRTNTAIAALQNSGLTKITIQPFQFIYPIPQDEINIMNNPAGFPQNPGYQ
jgi:hypothetical protein